MFVYRVVKVCRSWGFYLGIGIETALRFWYTFLNRRDTTSAKGVEVGVEVS